MVAVVVDSRCQDGVGDEKVHGRVGQQQQAVHAMRVFWKLWRGPHKRLCHRVPLRAQLVQPTVLLVTHDQSNQFLVKVRFCPKGCFRAVQPHVRVEIALLVQ